MPSPDRKVNVGTVVRGTVDEAILCEMQSRDVWCHVKYVHGALVMRISPASIWRRRARSVATSSDVPGGM